MLALSASSPLWHGSDTGYASIRSIIWQRWPTSGMTGPISTAAEYDALIAGLWRALVSSAIEAEEAGAAPTPTSRPLYRAAVWRAARSGLTGQLLDDSGPPWASAVGWPMS